MVQSRNLPIKACHVVLTRSSCSLRKTGSLTIPSVSAGETDSLARSRKVSSRRIRTQRRVLVLLRRFRRKVCFTHRQQIKMDRNQATGCYVRVERLRSVPVEDAQMCTKPCSIVCEVPGSRFIQFMNMGSLSIPLPSLPLSLSEYISPPPSRIEDQFEFLYRFSSDRSR
ncbi:hypothetical protein CRM22_003563 [Opisthorchis felineus]|uniref:Uncharacterized protein n=1 Tax=Opisthorchis felineus TaxID=147828 RepID=A0A4S2M158_OPIFE|nr:hypothetical protein CRM22_003563 [Opisthorchis felineus]TGZ69737.1 hypothetical protein CRM22_003563 [Opisthorchis felineus]